jgi:PAS domain-containing protein
MLSHEHQELANAKYVVFADASRRYLDCSDGVSALLGYTRPEILKMTIEDVSFNVDNVPHLFAQYLQRGKMDGEFVLRDKDGMPVPILYQAFVFADGCIAAVWDPIQDWRQPYLAALVELDPSKLKQRASVAMAAIKRRMSEPDSTTEEKQDLRDAASALQSLLRT